MSLFPEVDKQIKTIREKEKKEFREWIEKQKIFSPSNGTEASFFDGVCEGCSHYDLENPKCDIEALFWSGEPQKEMLELDDKIVCVKHTKFTYKQIMTKDN